MTEASRWVGIDLHRRRSHIAIVDEHGELTESRRIANDRGMLLELLGRRPDARRAGGNLRLGVARRTARGGRL